MRGNHTINVSTSTFIKAVLIALGVWFLWFIRDIVAMFIVAVMLAALIDPFADWFAKHRIPRGLAVLIVYVILLTITSLIIILLIPVIVEQFAQFISYASISSVDLIDSFSKLKAFSNSHGLTEQLLSGTESLTQGFNASIGSILNSGSAIFGSILGNVVGTFAALLFVLVLTFYMVVEENSMRKYFKSLMPVEYRPFFSQITSKMQKKIGYWLRAQLILGLIVGVLVYIGLKIIGVEYALLLAVIATVLEIVPYVGPIFSVIPALIIGFGQSVFLGVAVLVIYVIVQQLENNLLVPKIMQKVVGLNPVISILALLIGYKIGGVVGAILAIPITTMVAVIIEDLFQVDG